MHVTRRPALTADREPSRVHPERPVRTTALYAQDEWTHGRFTAQGALRFDNASSYSPPQTVGPALISGQTFLGTPLTFDRTGGVDSENHHAGGVAVDVFGNGETTVNMDVKAGSYMDPASNLSGNYSLSDPDCQDRHDRGPDVDRRQR